MDRDAFRQWATYCGLQDAAIEALSLAAAGHPDEELRLASRALLEGQEPPVVDAERSALAAVLAVPALVEAHARRGLPEPVSRATVADIALWIDEHRRRSGTWGLGETGWIRFHLAGRLLRLGRLQFMPAAYRGLADPEGQVRSGDPVLEIHIPAGEPLRREACDASLDEAQRVFADAPWLGFTCKSWLLGPRLADVLPGDANILLFQRRFRQLPSDMDDRQTIERVFGMWPLDRQRAPTASALQRTVLAYYDQGGRLPGGMGFIPR